MRLLRVGGGFLDEPLLEAGHEMLALPSPDAAAPSGRPPWDPFRDPDGARDLLAASVGSFRPDWILQVDDSSPMAHLGLGRFDVPKAWYAVDSHLHRWHAHYAAGFDKVFCAQRNQVGRLGAYQADIAWLPLCFTGEPAFLPWAGRVHDLAFVGTLDPALNPDRIALLEGLARLGLPVHAARGEYAPVYSRARVVVNQSASDDLNFRAFEAMGCGALLLTDSLSHSLAEIGEPGRDFLVYPRGDAGELARLARWALGHPAEAEAIARRGHERVKAGHLASHRARALSEALAAGAVRERLRPRSARGSKALAHLAAALEHISRLELPPEIARGFARDARRTAGDALMGDSASPWALVVLAQLELEAGRPGPALGFLERAGEEPGDPEYRRRYLMLLALLRGFAGRLADAKQALEEGLREFPGDADFGRLRGVLEAGPRG